MKTVEMRPSHILHTRQARLLYWYFSSLAEEANMIKEAIRVFY
jgi:hypothetical protein